MPRARISRGCADRCGSRHRHAHRAGHGHGSRRRVDTPLKIDGRLDEDVYGSVEPITASSSRSLPGVSGDTASYRGRFDYTDDRYGVSAEHTLIGRDFRPEVGYVRRTDFRRTFGLARFSPRPKNSRVRKLTLQDSLDYVTDAPAIAVQNREAKGDVLRRLPVERPAAVRSHARLELLPAKFPIAPGVVVAAGGYDYHASRVAYTLGQQRKVSGTMAASSGTLYNGTKSEMTYSGRWGVAPQFSIEPGVTLDWVSLPNGDFTATLVSSIAARSAAVRC